MIFDLTANNLISYDPTKSTENLRENFVAFIQGLISFPINIPGTAYHKCLQVLTSLQPYNLSFFSHRFTNEKMISGEFQSPFPNSVLMGSFSPQFCAHYVCSGTEKGDEDVEEHAAGETCFT